jgi:DNA-binding MarR family transcriptional regulator
MSASITPHSGAANGSATGAGDRHVKAAQDSYRDNFSRHLIGVSRYLQTRMMTTLQRDYHHNNLRLGFAPYLILVGQQGQRLSQLADTLGISRQACNQAVKQIEQAGYLKRSSDPGDGRAKQVTLTPAGEKLRRDGALIVGELDTQFAAIAGTRQVQAAAKTLGQLHKHLRLGQSPGEPRPFLYGGLGGLLPRLSDYINQRLMQLTIARGHPSLKLAFGQVLTLIGPAGGRIQQMAVMQDVSKQAISAITMELEALGYLRREQDPQDARQIVLFFTPRGATLIADSVSSVSDLRAEFVDIVGESAMHKTTSTLRTLYHGFGLESEIFNHGNTTDIQQLAQQLRARLDASDCHALGKLLLRTTGNGTQQLR